jgi:hypothetical protein
VFLFHDLTSSDHFRNAGFRVLDNSKLLHEPVSGADFTI